MKRRILLLLVLIVSINIFANDFENLNFGEDGSLEIATWNVEWFPKNGDITVIFVKQIIENLDVDLIAFQEIDDTLAFKELFNDLENWDGFCVKGEYRGLGYIYNSERIQVNGHYEIYTTQPYWRPFPRSPLVIELEFNDNNYYVIDNHLKAMGDGEMDLNDPWDEETRRYDACNLLKEYIENNLENENVFVVGDMNDVLTDNETDNVFMNLINDEENFSFADMVIAESNSENWSYPGWPSHLDHILITNELFDEFSFNNSEIATIRVDDYMDGGFSAYDDNISDHRPVAIKLFDNSSGSNNVANFPSINFITYPNPYKIEANRNTSLKISLESGRNIQGNVQVEIFNILGQKVKIIKESILENGKYTFFWNGKDNKDMFVSSGVYFFRLKEDNRTLAIKKSLLIK